MKSIIGSTIETTSPDETFEAGRQLGLLAKPGDIYTLNGDLGVAKGLDISGHVNSPTFTIVQVYDSGRLPFYHFNVYRIGDIEEMDEIGYEDYFFGDGVCMVEWADLISDLIPQNAKKITIEKNLEKGFNYRKITLE